MNITPSPRGIDCRIWNGVEIQRRPSDGYVNATAMCKANGKHLPHYMANDRTGQYLQALSGSVGIPTDLLKQTITTGLNHLRGTWIHPRLAVDLARWISPAFAVWMDGWFLDAAAGQVSHVRDVQPAVQQIARPEPTTVLTAPAHWCRMVDDYVADVEAGMADLPFAQRRRSLRYARPLATHFMQWLIDHQAHLVLSSSGTPAFAQPAIPGLQGHAPGDVVAGPDLARMLNLTCGAINHWARHQPIGAQRDGWRLIGRMHSQPAVRSSWLFQKV